MDKEKMQDIKERLDLFPSNMNEPAQKAYCELFDYINHLEQQCKKQKEIIDRLKELNLTISDSDYVYSQDEITSKNLELLQILEDKEVE